MKFLGKDKHGFEYYLKKDDYVYQKYPNEKIHDRVFASKWNGWFCSYEAWERTLYKVCEQNK